MNNLHDIPKEQAHTQDVMMTCRYLVSIGYKKFRYNEYNPTYLDVWLDNSVGWISGMDPVYFADTYRHQQDSFPDFDFKWFNI